MAEDRIKDESGEAARHVATRVLEAIQPYLRDLPGAEAQRLAVAERAALSAMVDVGLRMLAAEIANAPPDGPRQGLTDEQMALRAQRESDGDHAGHVADVEELPKTIFHHPV